ncbi:hypothetical protein AAG570_012920 [Ranatra chinensis]|uniref:Peptidase S1 domain-containing protein n=1 Tax=Ranatra chinensis TaxID=642074 RepID=A0ABD0YF90_9HEMI
MNQNVFNKYLSSISNNSEGKYCGKASEALSINVGKIFGQGEWPWLAAIFLRNDFGLQFHCSGSLISMKHIATAAHCTQDQDSGPILPEEFLIYLGKYNLEKWAEPNSQIREVSAIIVHPDFQLANYTADLAVLELSTPIIYNRFVRPVCLWNSHLSLQPPTGNFGIVVGWGKDKTGGPIRTEPRIVQLPIVGQEECLRSRKDFFYITSDRTLCAGFRNGTGPCNGDSGGGFIFFVPNENNEYVWQLRGIISLSLLDQDKLTCDLTHFAVFTDVARFTDWLTHTFNITY